MHIDVRQTKDNYTELIKLTVIEVNRVLATWEKTKTNYSLTEINSVGLSYLAKITGIKLGWGYWKRILKPSCPTFIIKNNRVLSIHCMRHQSDMVPLSRAMEQFDYNDSKLFYNNTDNSIYNIIDITTLNNIKF